MLKHKDIKEKIIQLEKSYDDKEFINISKEVEMLENSLDKLEFRMRLQALKEGMTDKCPNKYSYLALKEILNKNNLRLYGMFN